MSETKGGLRARAKARPVSPAPSSHRSRRLLIAVAIVLVALSLAACGPGASADARERLNAITLYNGEHTETTHLVAAFEQAEQTAGIKLAEGSRSPADVILTGNMPALGSLQRHELVASIESDSHRRARDAIGGLRPSPRGVADLRRELCSATVLGASR